MIGGGVIRTKGISRRINGGEVSLKVIKGRDILWCDREGVDISGKLKLQDGPPVCMAELIDIATAWEL